MRLIDFSKLSFTNKETRRINLPGFTHKCLRFRRFSDIPLRDHNYLNVTLLLKIEEVSGQQTPLNFGRFSNTPGYRKFLSVTAFAFYD